jgi:hypothetical protein
LRILVHLGLRSLFHILHLDAADELPLFRHPFDLIAHLPDLTHPVLEHTLVQPQLETHLGSLLGLQIQVRQALQELSSHFMVLVVARF